MSTGKEVSDFNMGNLIGGALSATAKASVELESNTLDFINEVGFEYPKKVEMKPFYHSRKIANTDRTLARDEVNEGVPLFATIPIPHSLVEEVKTQVDKKVKESKKD